MKVALDTSVLVAASVVGHVHGARAAVWVDAAREGGVEGIVSTHALAELWATLTAIPVKPEVPGDRITELVGRLRSQLHIQPLTETDYVMAMERCTGRERRSGALYDALHLVAAERARCDVLLTFNTAHFVALSTDDGPRVLAPPDPPALIESPG